jgi:hypothetical protein
MGAGGSGGAWGNVRAGVKTVASGTAAGRAPEREDARPMLPFHELPTESRPRI